MAYIFETERLILREFQENDFADVHEYGSDPEVARFTIRGSSTEQDTRDFLQSQIKHQAEQPRTVFDLALVLKTNRKVIGACGLHVNAGEKEAMMGYLLNKKYWNQGYMTEAARKIVQFGFENIGLNRIYATCDPANAASIRIMEKTGMKFEDTVKEKRGAKGGWRVSLLYAILKQD